MQYIEKHNKEADLGLHTYKLGMNKYGDMVNAYPLLYELYQMRDRH